MALPSFTNWSGLLPRKVEEIAMSRVITPGSFQERVNPIELKDVLIVGF
jgi:hypothetical protein